MPTLTYVDRFNFVTLLTLDQCYQQLSEAAKQAPERGKTAVCEVLHANNEQVVFAAKFALNQSSWYLAGQVKPLAAQRGNQVVCYSGLPIVTLVIPLIFLITILALVGVTNHLSVIAVIGLLIAVLIITGLVGIRYVRLFRQSLVLDIRKLLNAS
jgi:hypothetical protein